MKPIDLENAILIALRRCGAHTDASGMTVHRINALLRAIYRTPPSWRDVAIAVLRLERRGLVRLVDYETHGEDCHPLYALSPAGTGAARTVRIQQQNAGVLEEVAHGGA